MTFAPYEWFVPPTPSWWFTPLATAAVVVLLAALVLASWPSRLPGPLTAQERRVVRGPRWLRLAVAAVALVLLLAPATAVVLLCLNPRPPRVVVLQTTAVER